MKFNKFIVIPFIVAALAAVMQIIDQWLAANTIIGELLAGGGSWIAFQAWAVYFLGGCTIRGGLKGFLAMFAGIVASVLIMTLGGGAFSGLGFFGVPLAIFVVVIPCICLERVEIMDYVPALFIGSGAYFGIMGYIAPTVAAPFTGNFFAFGAVQLFYAVFGLVWGWITIVLRSKYEASVNAENPAVVDGKVEV